MEHIADLYSTEHARHPGPHHSGSLATVFSRIFTVIKAPITVNFNASFETWILL